jgi:membrane protein implicated in regulation of membrane protease activity
MIFFRDTPFHICVQLQWSLFVLTKSDPPSGGPILHGCHVATTATSAIHLAVTWQCLLAFDAVIVILTLLGGRSAWRNAQQWRLTTSNLVTIIARDGTLYFATAALANLANIITLYTAPPLLRGVLTSPASVFSVMICSRLVLNLHESSDTERLPFSHETNSALLDTDAQVTAPWAVDALHVRPLGAPLTTAGIHVRDAEEARTRTPTQNALDNDPEMMQMTQLRLREVTHP